jgi:hypothetical protein
MPRVGLEHTIPLFERAKTVHVLERAATAIGKNPIHWPQYELHYLNLDIHKKFVEINVLVLLVLP